MTTPEMENSLELTLGSAELFLSVGNTRDVRWTLADSNSKQRRESVGRAAWLKNRLENNVKKADEILRNLSLPELIDLKIFWGLHLEGKNGDVLDSDSLKERIISRVLAVLNL